MSLVSWIKDRFTDEPEPKNPPLQKWTPAIDRFTPKAPAPSRPTDLSRNTGLPQGGLPRAAQAPAPRTAAPKPAPKPVSLSRPSAQALTSMGWTLPEQTARAELDESLYDIGNAKLLAGHSYQLDPNEAQLLSNAYTGQAGFIPGQGKQASVSTGTVRAVPLTWEAYNALSKEQRQAVDFNTVFMKAREADLALQNNEGWDDEYTKKVENIFGKKGGSQTYAPNTVALLDKMGFTAKGQDLDEFLSLDKMVTADELANFKPVTQEVKEWDLEQGFKREGADSFLDFDLGSDDNKPKPPEEKRTGIRSFLDWDLGSDDNKPKAEPKGLMAFDLGGPEVGENLYADIRGASNQLAVEALAVQKAGAFIDEALQNTAAWDLDSAVVAALTGELPTGPKIPYGYGVSTDRMDAEGKFADPFDEFKDEFYSSAYTALTNPDQDVSIIWTEADKSGLSEENIQEMMNYFDLRSKRDIALGIVNPELRSATEIRKMVGLEA